VTEAEAVALPPPSAGDDAVRPRENPDTKWTPTTRDVHVRQPAILAKQSQKKA